MIHNFDYSSKENCVKIYFSLFCDLTTSTSGAALSLLDNANKDIELSHDLFINNKAPNIDGFGASIFCRIIPCINFTLLCSIFDHNGAYGCASFFISNFSIDNISSYSNE